MQKTFIKFLNEIKGNLYFNKILFSENIYFVLKSIYFGKFSKKKGFVVFYLLDCWYFLIFVAIFSFCWTFKNLFPLITFLGTFSIFCTLLKYLYFYAFVWFYFAFLVPFPFLIFFCIFGTLWIFVCPGTFSHLMVFHTFIKCMALVIFETILFFFGTLLHFSYFLNFCMSWYFFPPYNLCFPKRL